MHIDLEKTSKQMRKQIRKEINELEKENSNGRSR